MDAESGDGQRIFTGQIYVEQLMPTDGVKHPLPIVFIQGAGQTGTVSLMVSFLCLNGFLYCSVYRSSIE